MVGIDPVEVERQLLGGRLCCPCGGGLGPWGHARERAVRGFGALRPRRARCGTCRGTHVLLAVSCLWRRADTVEAIGAALAALLVELDPLVGPVAVRGSAFADAVEALGLVAAAARRRLPLVGAVSPWQLAAAVSGGRLLAPAPAGGASNTN